MERCSVANTSCPHIVDARSSERSGDKARHIIIDVGPHRRRCEATARKRQGHYTKHKDKRKRKSLQHDILCRSSSDFKPTESLRVRKLTSLGRNQAFPPLPSETPPKSPCGQLSARHTPQMDTTHTTDTWTQHAKMHGRPISDLPPKFKFIKRLLCGNPVLAQPLLRFYTSKPAKGTTAVQQCKRPTYLSVQDTRLHCTRRLQ